MERSSAPPPATQRVAPMAVAAPPAGRLANLDSPAPRMPGTPAAASALARDPDTPGSVGVRATPPPGNPGCGNPGAWSTPAPGSAGYGEPGAAAGPGSGYPCSAGCVKPAPRLPATLLRSGWRERLRADCLNRVKVSYQLSQRLFDCAQCVSAVCTGGQRCRRRVCMPSTHVVLFPCCLGCLLRVRMSA